ASGREAAPGAVVVEENEARRLALNHEDIVRSQVAVNEPGPMQAGNLAAQSAQQRALAGPGLAVRRGPDDLGQRLAVGAHTGQHGPAAGDVCALQDYPRTAKAA